MIREVKCDKWYFLKGRNIHLISICAAVAEFTQNSFQTTETAKKDYRSSIMLRRWLTSSDFLSETLYFDNQTRFALGLLGFQFSVHDHLLLI